MTPPKSLATQRGTQKGKWCHRFADGTLLGLSWGSCESNTEVCGGAERQRHQQRRSKEEGLLWEACAQDLYGAKMDVWRGCLNKENITAFKHTVTLHATHHSLRWYV